MHTFTSLNNELTTLGRKCKKELVNLSHLDGHLVDFAQHSLLDIEEKVDTLVLSKKLTPMESFELNKRIANGHTYLHSLRVKVRNHLRFYQA